MDDFAAGGTALPSFSGVAPEAFPFAAPAFSEAWDNARGVAFAAAFAAGALFALAPVFAGPPVVLGLLAITDAPARVLVSGAEIRTRPKPATTVAALER